MSYVISPHTLANWLKEEKEVVVIDVRADLHDEEFGQRAYEQDHLPGAHFLHLEKDLSGKVQKHGGNHPLPNLDRFAEKLGKIGVNHHKKIVVYDDSVNMFAPRAWLLLCHVGLEKVYVLDGGYEAWKEAGYEVSADIPKVTAGTFTPKMAKDEIVTMKEVKERSQDVILIDSRARERYLGLEEPLYDRAGHIPGAINYSWQDTIGENRRWKSESELQEHFQALSKDDNIIVSCGSGVSACANLLALRRIGFNHVKLYAGSFSDWISYESNSIETKDENPPANN